jgi:cellulase/cellobiase CelA1
VTVTNRSPVGTSAWTVTLTFVNGQQITQAWNATVPQNGATGSARSLSYNGALAAGASTSFGFLASWNNATNAVPAIGCTSS